MRELKFRAWHPVSEEMIHFDTKKMQRDRIVASHFFSLMNNEHENGKDLLMQFTGLKDKNGVEIYEGDLVKWGHIDGYEEYKPREAVVRLEPALCFDTFNLGKNNHTFHYGNFAYARSIDKAMEVIGNIHEHSELLNAKTN